MPLTTFPSLLPFVLPCQFPQTRSIESLCSQIYQQAQMHQDESGVKHHSGEEIVGRDRESLCL